MEFPWDATAAADSGYIVTSVRQSTHRRIALLAAVVIGLVVVGCGLSQKAEADPVRSNLDEQFILRGAQEATIQGENLRVRFDSVLEDSHCPTEVECFWTGQAWIALLVSPDGSAPATVEFNTNPAPGLNRQTLQTGGYTVELKSLEPYPRTPEC